MDGYILSIDQGTSGTKAIIFNHDGMVVSHTFQEVTQYYPREDWVEQDLNEIWSKTLQAVVEVFKNARILPEDIKAIGISTQRCTTTVWNRNSGEPVGRAILWQDRRTQEICDNLSAEEFKTLVSLTGITPVPNISCSKLQWLLTEDRTVQKALGRGELLFGTIDSWLIWKLTGGQFHLTDRSNAIATGMLNAKTLKYDDWILQKFSVPRHILPELRNSCEIYAYTDPAIFFGAQVPISCVIGDQPAAAYGQGCFSNGMIKNTYGTGSFMIMNTDSSQFPPGEGVVSPILWTINDKATYGLESYTDVSGAVLEWLRDGLGLLNDIRDADGLAMQVNDNQGVYFVPAMLGLGAPYFSPQARGTIVGINFATTKSHLVRAAVESMAYQTKDALYRIEQASGVKVKALRVDGGGVTSNFLLQFQADILDIPIDRPAVTEASALGAAYLAGLAVGYWQTEEEIASYWKLDTRFEPRIASSKRSALYEGWLEALETAKQWGMREITKANNEKFGKKIHSLSPRELEVVQAFVKGQSMREIANQSFTSLKTVEKQRRDAMRKMGVNTLADLVRVSLELGIISTKKN